MESTPREERSQRSVTVQVGRGCRIPFAPSASDHDGRVYPPARNGLKRKAASITLISA
jgi:hypothetical protein